MPLFRIMSLGNDTAACVSVCVRSGSAKTYSWLEPACSVPKQCAARRRRLQWRKGKKEKDYGGTFRARE